jgi:hypothetical protein
MLEPIDVVFPRLQNSTFHVSSPATRDYNCIAWAAGSTAHWWWPDLDPDNDTIFWPAGVANEETVAAFEAMFRTLGYTPCLNATFEPGFEKVALFAKSGIPTHAARQLTNGRWTSKLGLREDIEHELNHITGEVYGEVVLLLKRERDSFRQS